MLKDFLADLQASSAEIAQRRSLGESALASALTPSSPNGPRGRGRRKGKSKGPTTHGGSRLDAFLQGIADQESGGNYSAVGVPTKYGTAYGKYQILDSNIKGPGGWDKEALGRDISINKFLNNPRLQEKIAQAKLSDYFRQYGAKGAAKAWYAGPGNWDSNSTSSQYGGPSIVDYANSVLKHMRDHL